MRIVSVIWRPKQNVILSNTVTILLRETLQRKRKASWKSSWITQESLWGPLGYKIFEPVAAIPEDFVAHHSDSGAHSEPPLFQFNRSTERATGRRTSDGFVVLKGGTLAIKLQHSCPENVRRYREKCADKIDENGTLTVDVPLTSPSAAAAFVGGSSLSGNLMWKTDDGKTLIEFENN